MTEPLLLKAEQVAEILQISKAQVYALAADGTLPNVRFGPKCIRFPQEKLREWVDERTVEA